MEKEQSKTDVQQLTGILQQFSIENILTAAQNLGILISQDQDENRIERLIDDLKSESYDVRESATEELVLIGPRILDKLERALKVSTDEEQKARLGDIIHKLKSVTSISEWKGNDLGVFNFIFNVHVPVIPFDWTKNVCDLHFMVGKPNQATIDHINSTIVLEGFPDGWQGRYNPEVGEYQFKWVPFIGSDEERCKPLVPCNDYQITIRTETMRRGKVPSKMSWYWTDKNGKLIGDAHGEIEGPVFLP